MFCPEFCLRKFIFIYRQYLHNLKLGTVHKLFIKVPYCIRNTNELTDTDYLWQKHQRFVNTLDYFLLTFNCIKNGLPGNDVLHFPAVRLIRLINGLPCLPVV